MRAYGHVHLSIYLHVVEGGVLSNGDAVKALTEFA
jgi:hypothetical protein